MPLIVKTLVETLTLHAMADALGGRWTGERSATAQAIGTDSRAVAPGMLFVALRGERFDGHRYALRAIEAGAVAVLVDHDLREEYPALADRQLIVPDTRLALGLLAGVMRDRWQGTLIALTGNSGKTTVKEMLLTILKEAVGEAAVMATQGNFNNDIGAPLTLLRLSEAHRYAVIELGANHIGEIAWTASWARPDVSLITNVTGAHIGEFGGMGMIAQAKSEIISATAPAGRTILPAGDRYTPFWRALASRQCDAPSELFGLNYVEGWHARACTLSHKGTSFTLCQGDSALGAVTLNLLGQHNVVNALAAAAAAHAAGIDNAAIVRGLNGCGACAQRMMPIRGVRGTTLLDDSYNANPGAMKAALDTLLVLPGPHWCFMGAMGELGAASDALHAEVGQYARARGIALVTFGEAARAAGGHHFDDWSALVAYAHQTLPEAASVLIKGSHAAHMECLVAALRADGPSADSPLADGSLADGSSADR